jgi:hypothetical protein
LSASLGAFTGSYSWGVGGGYGLEVSRRPFVVARTLLHCLDTHTRVKSILESYATKIKNNQDVLFTVYQDMSTAFQELQDNRCEIMDYPTKGESFVYSWDQDESALDFKVLYDKFTTINSLKQRFDTYLSPESMDETELLAVVEDLMALKASGDIDIGFCVKENRAAKQMIHQADQIYRDVYDKVRVAIFSGALKIRDRQGSAFSSRDDLVGQSAGPHTPPRVKGAPPPPPPGSNTPTRAENDGTHTGGDAPFTPPPPMKSDSTASSAPEADISATLAFFSDDLPFTIDSQPLDEVVNRLACISFSLSLSLSLSLCHSVF